MAGRVSLAQPNTEFYWMSLALALSDRHQGLYEAHTPVWFLILPFPGTSHFFSQDLMIPSKHIVLQVTYPIIVSCCLIISPEK